MFTAVACGLYAATACLSVPDDPRNLGKGTEVTAGNGGAGGGTGAMGGWSGFPNKEAGAGGHDGGIGGGPETEGGLGGAAGGSGDGGSGGDSGACPTGQKLCPGGCVSISDPKHGCASSSCAPCGGAMHPHVTSLKCDQGACAVGSCDAGFGDCNKKLSDGCEKSTESDPANCGACNWNCEGASCQSGLCGKQQLATGVLYGTHIAVDSASLYWASGTTSGVKVANKNGTLKSGPKFDYPALLEIDKTHVYFTTNGSGAVLARWPKAGGAVQTLYSGQRFRGLAVDDTMLYAVDYESWANPKATFYSGPKDGTGKLASLDPQANGFRDITTDATTVYWTSWDDKIRRLPKTGGAINTQLAGPTGSKPWGMVVSGGKILWRGFDTIQSASVGSNQATPVLGNQSHGKALAVYDPYLFFTNEKQLVMVNRITKAERVLASTESADVLGMAADDKFVYYLEYTNTPVGRVFRVRHPAP